jgi:hypothetical protein
LAKIVVQRIDDEDMAFRVTVTEGGSQTTHDVTATPEDLQASGADSAEALVEASFKFLLERESKESILRRFELSVISRYFPEYPDEIKQRLRSGN